MQEFKSNNISKMGSGDQYSYQNEFFVISPSQFPNANAAISGESTEGNIS